jgi:flavodoxin I
MNKIGIFFGTDTGTTRLIAKKMAKVLGPDLADKPLNVNRIEIADILKYSVLILGTPSYGEGILPGKSTGIKAGSWEEFVPQLEGVDLSDKVIALYGLGDQDKYPQRFADSLMQLYLVLKNQGATIVGEWSTDGYEFETSKSVIDDKFVGLVIDHGYQGLLTDGRIKTWFEQIKPTMIKHMESSSVTQVA